MLEHFYQTIEGWFDFEDVYREMVKRANFISHFVEVGAFKGKSTAYMAVEIANCKKAIRFDVVDTWQGSLEHQKGEFSEDSSVVANHLFEDFSRNTSSVADFIRPVRMTSLEASRLYPDKSLDFVFIDASHDYDNVKADILAWKPKIKPGGYLGGHDLHAVFPGVERAVRELFPVFEIVGCSWLVRIEPD
jgi:hypothetical protein